MVKFRYVCGPTEAADWKYCPKNGGNKLSVKQPFQRVVLEKIWMNCSQDMAQRRSWGLAENGLLYFGLFETQGYHNRKQIERCPLAFLRAWLQQIQRRREQGGLHRKLDSPFWAFRHNMGLLQKFFASSRLNTSTITTRRSAILWDSFRFPRLLAELQWTKWILHSVIEVGLILYLSSTLFCH